VGPLTRIDEAAKEAGVSRWTLLKVARGKAPNPRHKLLAKMAAYYARKDQQQAAA